VDKNNFSWLLLALLVFLIVVPVAGDLHAMSGPVVRALSFSWLLLIGIWSLRRGGRIYFFGMSLVLAAVVMNVLAANLQSSAYIYASFAFTFGFLLLAISFTLKQVALSTDISANRLVGAVCVYLLLGVIWAVAYTVLNMIAPGSFQGFVPTEGRSWNSEWLYFSFVTMTTLGYGDISPVTATARALAYMQALFGQLYVAILVAGLVSSYISSRQRNDQNDG
jgi:voltage-gated potassium channel